MTERPKLLFLSQTLPFPLDSGQAVRSYNVLKILAGNFAVHAMCFYRSKGGAAASHLAESRAALNAVAPTEIFSIPQEHSRPRLAWDHLRSVGTSRVYTRYAYRSVAFRRRLRELVATRAFEIVHLDSLDLSDYIGNLPGVPLVCAHNNVESALLRRRAAVESGLRRRYLDYQAGLYEKEERAYCPRMDLNIAVSREDATVLSGIVPQARIAVVPNGVDLDYFQPGLGDGRGIAFLGGTTWFPNKDGLIWFREAILPLVRARAEGAVEVRWIGHATAEEQRLNAERYGIELTGYVPDIRPYMRDAACFAVPLRVGGGTRLKILDAWAMGKAVVSTTVGCEGLEAEDGVNILVRDTPESFADAIQSVLSDGALRGRLGTGARATVERRYGWVAIGADMTREYQEIIEARSGSQS